MTVSVDIGRQSILSAIMEFTYADLTSNTVVTDEVTKFFDLPPNSVVIGGELAVTTAWVGPTAATLDVGDGADATRYAANVNLLATGRTALTLTGFKNTAWAAINVRLTQTVAVASAGAARLILNYVTVNRVSENV